LERLYDALETGKIRLDDLYNATPTPGCSRRGGEFFVPYSMVIVPLSGNGEIQTFTVIFVSPEGFEAPPGETEVPGVLPFRPTGLNTLPPPPVWVASAVIGQVASRLSHSNDRT
jgi:uncharacterized OB-fold protein